MMFASLILVLALFEGSRAAVVTATVPGCTADMANANCGWDETGNSGKFSRAKMQSKCMSGKAADLMTFILPCCASCIKVFETDPHYGSSTPKYILQKNPSTAYEVACNDDPTIYSGYGTDVCQKLNDVSGAGYMVYQGGFTWTTYKCKSLYADWTKNNGRNKQIFMQLLEMCPYTCGLCYSATG